MPPIQIHSEDPIKAEKATPLPTQPSTTQPSEHLPPYTPANTSQANVSSNAYPSARPGAPPVPAPTAAINTPFPQITPQPTRTQPLQDSYDPSNPPPPQPGAVPVAPPPSARYHTTAQADTVPQPPPSSANVPTMPPQFNIPPPTTNLAPTHSTSIAAPEPISSSSGSSLSHPPGYQQNVFATEMTAAQRAQQARLESNEGLFATVGQTNTSASTSNTGFLGSAGAGTGGGFNTGSSGPGIDVNQAWAGVKGFMSNAGKKLAEVEGEVWKKVNEK